MSFVSWLSKISFFQTFISPYCYLFISRRLRNAKSRINTAYFWPQNKISPLGYGIIEVTRQLKPHLKEMIL